MLTIENHEGRLLHGVCLDRGRWGSVWIVGSWTRILSAEQRKDVGSDFWDWAAYIGTFPSVEADIDAIKHVREQGTKVSRDIAMAVFGPVAERYEAPWRV